MTTIGIIQPNFIPWRGYFDFIREVDIFVFLDDVQYTPRDWRNRNRVRTKSGTSRWLTVPVRASNQARILEVEIDLNSDWRRTHLNILSENYGDAPFIDLVLPMLDESYRRHKMLCELDIDLCTQILRRLAVHTPLVRSSMLCVPGRKDEKLIGIVKAVGGTRYLSGPTARAYLQPTRWIAAGIELSFKVYPEYPRYHQIAAPFDPYVSIIDLLAMTGDQASSYLLP